MRRLFCFVLALQQIAFAAAITSTSSGGNWNAGGSWVGGVAPGIGDTATIANTATITVPTSVTVTAGTSPASAGVVLALGTGGQLVVNGTLNLRGSLSSGAGTDVAITVNAGGTFNWDDTAGKTYQYQPSGNRSASFVGTSGSCTFNTITELFSGATCAIGTSTTPANGSGWGYATGHVGGFAATYAAFSNLGSASVHAIAVDAFGGPVTPLHMDHFSLSASGDISAANSTDVLVNNCITSGDLGTFNLTITDGAITGKKITDCVFDKPPQVILIGSGWDLRGNYYNAKSNYSTASANSAQDANMDYTFEASAVDPVYPALTLTYLHGYNYRVPNNPKFEFTSPSVLDGVTITRIKKICEGAESVTNDTGECINYVQNPASPTTILMKNGMIIPDKFGRGVAQFTAMVGTSSLPNLTFTFLHNTVMVGTPVDLRTGALQIDEGGATAATAVMKGNIIADMSGLPASAFKAETQTPAAPSDNTCTTCNYNAGYNLLPTLVCPSAIPGNCTNQGNAYTVKNTAGVLGLNDIDALAGGGINPGFKQMRWLATEDISLWGNPVCTRWVSGHAYAKYDCFSYSSDGLDGTSLITSSTLAGGNAGGYDYWFGEGITNGAADKIVTGLGRTCYAGDSHQHSLILALRSGATITATYGPLSITCAGAGNPTANFTTAVPIPAGTTFSVFSAELNGSDVPPLVTPVTTSAMTVAATFNQGNPGPPPAMPTTASDGFAGVIGPVQVIYSKPVLYNGITINYYATAAHTSSASTEPDFGSGWQAVAEYASLKDMRTRIVNYTSGDRPVKTDIDWLFAGWTPTNAAYRTTFPGDTNPVTNMGAAQMDPISGVTGSGVVLSSGAVK